MTSLTFVYRQIEALIEAGHEVSVLARQPSTDPSANTVNAEQMRVFQLPGNERFRHERLLKLAVLMTRSCLRHPAHLPAYLRALRLPDYIRGRWNAKLFATTVTLLNQPRPFDVFCCHFGYNGAEAALWRDAGALPGKIVTIFHGVDISSYLDAHPDAYDQLKEEGDLFLTISERWKTRLEERGFPPEKIRVHHMGVSCSEIAFTPTPLVKPFKLLSVARLVEKKGLIYAIRALPTVVEKYPDLTYTIIGEGPLGDELEAEAERLGMQANVKFLGAQPSHVVFAELSKAHVLLAPSVKAQNGDMEGIPVAMMEAMAQGTPVLSTWHSGIPELVEHDVSGYLVPERDSDALAEGLLELLAAPKSLVSISRAARNKVEREFNNDVLNEQFVKLIDTL